MKIRQGYIRPSMAQTFPNFMGQWGLVPYYDRRQPAVFFGCYNDRELKLLRRHIGRVLVVWLGGDFPINGTRDLFLNRPDQFTHIAIGKWLEADLRASGLPWRRVNLVGSPLIRTLKPVPLGTAVYSYMPPNAGDNFGAEILAEVQRLRPDVEYITHPGPDHVPMDKMPAVYERCCLGLRFTRHDGIGSTVIELGLMGRRCVHNGDIPSGIPWETAADAVTAIDEALARVGETDTSVATSVHDHLQWDDSWLEVEA